MTNIKYPKCDACGKEATKGMAFEKRLVCQECVEKIVFWAYSKMEEQKCQ